MTPATNYAAYVWSAYGATAFIMGALVIRAVIEHRRAVRDLARHGLPAVDGEGR